MRLEERRQSVQCYPRCLYWKQTSQSTCEEGGGQQLETAAQSRLINGVVTPRIIGS